MMNDAKISSHQIFDSILSNDLTDLQTRLKINPDNLEYMDECSNTPLLYACYCGRSRFVDYLLAVGANHQQLNIFGQNALTLATYSGDIDTCYILLNHVNFNDANATGILTPLCVATLQGNIDIAQIYLTLETPKQNLFDCPSQSIHGICPLQLAEINGNTQMIDLLRPKHHLHIFKSPVIET